MRFLVNAIFGAPLLIYCCVKFGINTREYWTVLSLAALWGAGCETWLEHKLKHH